jgi:hypothetical protein
MQHPLRYPQKAVQELYHYIRSHYGESLSCLTKKQHRII